MGRVVACRQHKHFNELLAGVVMKVGRCVGRQGDWSVGVLAIMAMGEVQGNLDGEVGLDK